MVSVKYQNSIICNVKSSSAEGSGHRNSNISKCLYNVYITFQTHFRIYFFKKGVVLLLSLSLSSIISVQFLTTASPRIGNKRLFHNSMTNIGLDVLLCDPRCCLLVLSISFLPFILTFKIIFK